MDVTVLVVEDGRFYFAQGVGVDYGAQGDTVSEAVENFRVGLIATLNMPGNLGKVLPPAPGCVLDELRRSGAIEIQSVVI
jgi:hypothetical protein